VCGGCPHSPPYIRQVRLLASVSHPNIIGYHEAFLDPRKAFPRLCIIMEYAPDGDVSKLIKKWAFLKRPMPEELVWKLFIQVVAGLQALHCARVLHRDIKPVRRSRAGRPRCTPRHDGATLA